MSRKEEKKENWELLSMNAGGRNLVFACNKHMFIYNYNCLHCIHIHVLTKFSFRR